MAVPKTTTWKAEPHTLVKHAILRRYLNAWLPIMGKWNGRIVLIDGFAGPGLYEGGEPGSPVIALKCIIEHPAFKTRSPSSGVSLLLIEKDPARAEHLELEIEKLKAASPFPTWLSSEVACADFATRITALLDDLDARKARLAPTFAFIDPFGFAGVPLELIGRIVKNDKCECLVTFMYESINRFLAHPTPEIQSHFDQLFGTTEWREIVKLEDPTARRNAITALYRAQLQKVGLPYVRMFEMLNDGNRTEYFLYFGTKSTTGLSKMKQAMWAADPVLGSVFSDRTQSDQIILLTPETDTLPLRSQLLGRFKDAGSVTIEDVEQFVLVDTAFSECMHLKQKTLKPLEQCTPPRIEVQRPDGARKIPGQYPAGTTVRFL